MGKHLVLVGAGHAHMSTLLHIADLTASGHHVTVVSPSRYHYYSGMGPGMLSGIYRPQEIRFNVEQMATKGGAEFITGSVVRIDAPNRILHLSGGRRVSYDVASFNTGSDVATADSQAGGTALVAKPIIHLYEARQSILKALSRGVQPRLVVAGGGPAGCEIAANLWRLFRDSGGAGSITLVAGKRVMSGAPGGVRERLLASFARRGVRVVEGRHVSAIEDGRVILDDSSGLDCDFTILATGVRPSQLFKESGIATGSDGGMLVDRFLRSRDYPELLGGGDCISFMESPLAKVGVYAVRQNPFLLHNIKASLNGGELRPFTATGGYMLIMNMGDGTGVLWRDSLIWSGRLVFLLKDLIDRRFMKRFQVSGEASEPCAQIDS